MTCRHCQQLLSPYLDNALSDTEREDLATHLPECTVCREILRQLESTRQLLQTLPAREITPAMETQLWERLISVKTSKNHWRKAIPFLHRGREGSEFIVRLLSWRHWGGLSLGTLVTAAATLLFYIAAPLEQRDPVTTVAFSNQLLEALDYDQKTLTEDPAEIPAWPEEISAWDTDDAQD